jgi:hypothetical protein
LRCQQEELCSFLEVFVIYLQVLDQIQFLVVAGLMSFMSWLALNSGLPIFLTKCPSIFKAASERGTPTPDF